MKLAVREGMLPGASLEEKLRSARRLGYEGVELHSPEALARPRDELVRLFRESGVEAANVAGVVTLLDPDPKARGEGVETLAHRLELAAALGATGVLVVPIFGRALIPDLSPYREAIELERELLIAELGQVAALAAASGSQVFLEPLNRYETHFLNRLEQGVEICRAVGSPRIRIMADFFHMHIEEADIPESLRAAGDYVVYVHVADSNRMQPGRGHLDLRPGFAALKEIGYDGYLGVECGLIGPIEAALAEAAENVRRAWSAA